MTDYTEDTIRELTGRELEIAFCLLVLGDDLTANTDERIRDAVDSFPERALTPYEDGLLQDTLREGLKPGNPYRPWYLVVWDQRDKLSFKSDLEQHVANWRAEPRRELSSLDYLVPTLLGPGGVLECHNLRWNNEWYVADPRDRFVDGSDPDDPATALLRAACIVRKDMTWKTTD